MGVYIYIFICIIKLRNRFSNHNLKCLYAIRVYLDTSVDPQNLKNQLEDFHIRNALEVGQVPINSSFPQQ